MSIVMIDTKAGNFGSVKAAFNRIGADVHVSNNKNDIDAATALILPGVSAFEHGMNSLKELDLIELIQKKVSIDKTPILGICLGMQLLADSSTESRDGSKIKGLELISGTVEKLEPKPPQFMVPNIGWHDVKNTKNTILFPESYESKTFYHVHSYFFNAENEEDVAAYIKYGDKKIAVSLEKDNIFGAQFHPEKSQDAGLDFLKRFVDYIAQK